MALHVGCENMLQGYYSVSQKSEDLKHIGTFGKSETLSKTFYAEILVFHPDYEYKSLSSNGPL